MDTDLLVCFPQYLQHVRLHYDEWEMYTNIFTSIKTYSEPDEQIQCNMVPNAYKYTWNTFYLNNFVFDILTYLLNIRLTHYNRMSNTSPEYIYKKKKN